MNNACWMASLVSSLAMISTACVVDDQAEEEIGADECPPIPKGHPDSEALLRLDRLGFCAGTFIDLGDSFLIEGDILFDKETLTHKQYRRDSLVSQCNILRMTVRVASSIPTGGADDWRSAVQSAIGHWNSIGTSDINFVYTTGSSADIVVQSDDDSLPDFVIATATFPSGGDPGEIIQINLDYLNNKSIPENQKVYNMAHELGHAIGLRHTNWSALNEPTAIHIDGTPTTDGTSVMNGGTAESTWAGFSSGDLSAAFRLYPAQIWLRQEFSQCTGLIANHAIDWGSNSGSCPIAVWDVDKKYVASSWHAFYDGTGTTKAFSEVGGQNVSFRARGRTSDGVWTPFRQINFRTSTCSGGGGPDPF